MNEIMQDLYQWRAIYNDDSSLDERDAAQGFASVDQERLAAISLLINGATEHSVVVPQGAQSVCFRRRSIALNLIDESAEQRQTIHCIGWKRDGNAVYLFVFENGSTLLTNDLQAA